MKLQLYMSVLVHQVQFKKKHEKNQALSSFCCLPTRLDNFWWSLSFVLLHLWRNLWVQAPVRLACFWHVATQTLPGFLHRHASVAGNRNTNQVLAYYIRKYCDVMCLSKGNKLLVNSFTNVQRGGPWNTKCLTNKTALFPTHTTLLFNIMNISNPLPIHHTGFNLLNSFI